MFFLEAVHATVSTNDGDIERRIYLFLKDAKDRCGGRKSRENKKKKEQSGAMKRKSTILSDSDDS